MKFIYKTKLAFTLIEILVSMSIFLIIFFVTLANFKYSQKSNDFKLQSFDIEDSIRATQNMSLTGKQINGILPGNGYGINFNISNNSYTVYGDRSDNTSVGVFDIQDSVDSSSVIKSIIHIEDILCYSTEAGDYVSLSSLGEKLDILFYPPRASVIVNNNTDYTSCYIKLVANNISDYWKINIDVPTSRIWSDYITD